MVIMIIVDKRINSVYSRIMERNKPYAPSITRSLRNRADHKGCEILAQIIWETALQGNSKALEMIYDRLEGKVPQTIQHATEIVLHHGIPEIDEKLQLSEGVEVVEADNG